MTHRRWTLGALAVATLSLGLPGSPSPAVAEPLDSSVRHRLDGVAAEIERVSDEIMVKGHTAATDVEIRGQSAAALSAYFDSLRMERRSMEQNGGVTVLATTARLEALPGTSAGSPISAELHVTRTVAEVHLRPRGLRHLRDMRGDGRQAQRCAARRPGHRTASETRRTHPDRPGHSADRRAGR